MKVSKRHLVCEHEFHLNLFNEKCLKASCYLSVADARAAVLSFCIHLLASEDSNWHIRIGVCEITLSYTPAICNNFLQTTLINKN